MKENNKFEFNWLIRPISPTIFFLKYWEKETLLIPRDDSNYWGQLLSLNDIDHVLSSMNLSFPDILLTKADEELPKESYLLKDNIINISKVYQYFSEGHTIIINNLQNRLPSLAEFCRYLEKDLNMPFQTNIYLTPSNSKGFKAHYDDHCVFILQIAGIKRWRIYQKIIDYPTKDYSIETSPDQIGELSMEFDLKPGDILYIPRGMVHEAATNEMTSLHITLGAMAYTWVDLFPEILNLLLMTDTDFRKSIPNGMAKDTFDIDGAYSNYLNLIDKLKSKQAFENGLDHFIDKFITSRKPILNGQLKQFKKINHIMFDKALVRRSHVIYRLKETSELIHISAYDTKISFPINLKETVLFALNEDRFFIKDLPGNLDTVLKKVIVQKLVGCGLLMFEN